MKPLYDTGVIHGRFQVLHNDHLAYLISGKNLCRHLVVGITNPEPVLTRDDDADPERSCSLYNPLTYYERYRLVRAALKHAGLSLDDFSIVPLPINYPERYRFYVPLEAVFFVSIYDDWGRKKLDYFRSLGLKTHVLREAEPGEKGISGRDVRGLMMKGEKWEHLVPEPVARLLVEWDLGGRLRSIDSDA